MPPIQTPRRTTRKSTVRHFKSFAKGQEELKQNNYEEQEEEESDYEEYFSVQPHEVYDIIM